MVIISRGFLFFYFLFYLFTEVIWCLVVKVTDGIAVSELLMSTYRESQKLNTFASKNDPPTQTYSKSSLGTNSFLNEQDIIEKYTNLLLQGDKNAALGEYDLETSVFVF